MEDAGIVPKMQIVISLLPDNRVIVQGPCQDKMACYGLLDCAKDAIRDLHTPRPGTPVPEIEIPDGEMQKSLLHGHNGSRL